MPIAQYQPAPFYGSRPRPARARGTVPLGAGAFSVVVRPVMSGPPPAFHLQPSWPATPAVPAPAPMPLPEPVPDAPTVRPRAQTMLGW